VPNQEHPKRRWPLRLIAAAPGCLFSAIFVAIQIPAVREAVGIAKATYRFINSTVPSLGVAAIWIGFVLIVSGVVAAWRFHRALKEGTIKMMAVGSAVLAVALGGLVAAVSTLNPPSAATSSYEANTGSHHRRPRPHHHHHPTPAKHSSSGGSKATRTPPPASPSSTPTPTPTPAPAPAPNPPPSGGGSSSSSGSGGNSNNVTVNKKNEQTATSGNAEGPGATSGPATNNNNEGPTNISIG
jgi:hypothetical protein